MAAQLREIRADVNLEFLVRCDHYGLLLFATLFSKTKLIYTVRVSPGKGNSNEMNRLKHRLAFWFADGVWIQTEDQKQFYPKRIQKKMFEVHNILSPAFLKIERKSREQIAHFVSAGRLHPQKNQKLLIEAFEGMIRSTGNTSATLTIGGNSRKNYRWADAFVFGSDYEGCSNALMEAMSHAMQYLIEHPQEANRLGDAARQRMQEWGTSREYAEQLRENLCRICL